jgi:hypothetical protein
MAMFFEKLVINDVFQMGWDCGDETSSYTPAQSLKPKIDDL